MKSTRIFATLFLFSAALTACTFSGELDDASQEPTHGAAFESSSQEQLDYTVPTVAGSDSGTIVAVSLPTGIKPIGHEVTEVLATPPDQPHNGTSLNGLLREGHGA